MTKKWNGEFRSLVISETGNPELYEELARFNHRERTNRLRTLALLGYYALQTRTAPVVAVAPQNSVAGNDQEVTTQQKEPVNRRLEKKRRGIGDKMLGSIS